MITNNKPTISVEDLFLNKLFEDKFIPYVNNKLSKNNDSLSNEVSELLQKIIRDVNEKTEDKITLYSDIQKNSSWKELCKKDTDIQSANLILDTAIIYLNINSITEIESPVLLDRKRSFTISTLNLAELNTRINHEETKTSGKNSDKRKTQSGRSALGSPKSSLTNRVSQFFSGRSGKSTRSLKTENSIFSSKKNTNVELKIVNELFGKLSSSIVDFQPRIENIKEIVNTFCDTQDTLPDKATIRLALTNLSRKERVKVYFAIERTLKYALTRSKIDEFDEDSQNIMLDIANEIVKIFNGDDQSDLDKSIELGNIFKNIISDKQASDALLLFLKDIEQEQSIYPFLNALIEYNISLNDTNSKKLELKKIVDEDIQKIQEGSNCLNISVNEEMETVKDDHTSNFKGLEYSLHLNFKGIISKC
jgi:hypothetical protein